MADRQERYQATLVGCAVGDALGMPVEGWNREQIRKYVGKVSGLMAPVIPRDAGGNALAHDEYGAIKSWTAGLMRGEYTDDTILTLAIAESLVARRGPDLHDAAQRQLRAFDSRVQPDGHVRGAFGGSTREAFARLRKGISPFYSGANGPGTGPMMKMSPVGLYMDAADAYAPGLEFARQIGRMTHLDERSVAGGVVQAHAVYHALQGVSREEFIDSLVSVSRIYEEPLRQDAVAHERGTLTEKLAWIGKNRDIMPDDAHAYLGSSGLAVEAYPFSLFMLQKFWDDPVTGLIETVNYGGDCDTTGAMFGALAGARHGMVFPREWVEDILNISGILALGKSMYEMRL
ncbi:MAG TPA: ADP-ribosylglycohydrolase family protein [Candidatus Nanoarchaeia archaeon]|nr:ADP-ribosylglycohydrolase family protein [Candidatus Nanoarchaeia archaeon]